MGISRIGLVFIASILLLIGIVLAAAIGYYTIVHVGTIPGNVSADQNNTTSQNILRNPSGGISLNSAMAQLQIGEGSPEINITYPRGDGLANVSINVKGFVTDNTIKTIDVDHNGRRWTAPVTDGGFNVTVNLTSINNITLSAVDSSGGTISKTLLLDGDMLPMTWEPLLGFDPQNPDSDSTLTQKNEGGNGILDGRERLDGSLECVMKLILGLNPFIADTDEDGLTDDFELVQMCLYTSPTLNDTDGNGISDAMEDQDRDGITNIREQELGTDPMNNDTDGDTLCDSDEVNVYHTNPALKDTDKDGLDDDSEVRLGTSPLKPDTDSDGVLDGNETYTSSRTDNAKGVTIYVTGRGDAAKRASFYLETSEYYANISSRLTPLLVVDYDPSASAAVLIKYDAKDVKDPANLKIFYYNETYGLYVPLDSTVDTVNDTVYARIPQPGMLAGFDAAGMAAMYKTISDFNGEIAGYMTPATASG